MSDLQAGRQTQDTTRAPGAHGFSWPSTLQPHGEGIGYGGDYNPDQWPESVWDQDIELMKKASVNTVALAIFSWGRIQPKEFEWDFDWLDCIIDKLGQAGIAVDLSTATATAPLWLYREYPQVLPIEKNGDVVNPGSRQSWSPTSPIFKKYALELCQRLAARYGSNEYVTAWHVNNEYGWNNRYDYSDNSLQAFREWCKKRYVTIEGVNEAWGTAFWSQELSGFDDIFLPRHMGMDSMVNPAQKLDFERFGSQILKEFYKAERDVIKGICPEKPCTTNFMISTDQCSMDYADWAPEVDFVSNDHYFTPGKRHLDELVCSDSLVDSLAQFQPWCLMEHSTSAVQWKPVNSRKKAGELQRDAIAHLAMGADAINFFQWRQSRSGAEAFHSAMIPHAGTKSQIFRSVCDLGREIRILSDAGLQGTHLSKAQCAILFDADCEWSTRSETLPSSKLSHWKEVFTWYQAFLDDSCRADIIPLKGDWNGYSTIVLPTMFVLSKHDAERIREYVERGGCVVIGYASGIADQCFRVALGGYPGMLRDVAGIRSEEFNVLGELDGEDSGLELSNGFSASFWANVVTSVDSSANVIATYQGEESDDWELTGMPAIVHNSFGRGSSFYIGCDLGREDLSEFIRRYIDAERLSDCASLIHTCRSDECHVFDFYFNRSSQPIQAQDIQSTVLISAKTHPLALSGSYEIDKNGYLVTSRENSSDKG